MHENRLYVFRKSTCLVVSNFTDVQNRFLCSGEAYQSSEVFELNNLSVVDLSLGDFADQILNQSSSLLEGGGVLAEEISLTLCLEVDLMELNFQRMRWSERVRAGKEKKGNKVS